MTSGIALQKTYDLPPATAARSQRSGMLPRIELTPDVMAAIVSAVAQIKPPSTGSEWEETTTWFDGLPMRDDLCDDISFRKVGNKYEQRQGVRSAIQMDRYLTADGNTDTLEQWDSFLTYLRKLRQKTHIHLVVPSGTYYSSGCIRFYDLYLTIENYGLHVCPGGVAPALWLVANTDKTFVEVTGLGIWFQCLNKAPDGLIANNDPDYLRRLSELPDLRWDDMISPGRGQYANKWGGKTFRQYMSGPPGELVQSIYPEDYKFNGFMSTSVSDIKVFNIDGFTASGVRCYGPNITVSDPYLAPSRFNTSYSSYRGTGFIAHCGFGFSVSGSDANHVKIYDLDLRESDVVNYWGLSQSGTVLFGVAEELGTLGGFWSFDNGVSNGYGLYCETEQFSYNIFRAGEWHGIFNKGCYGNGAVWDGRTVTQLHIGRAEVNELRQGAYLPLFRYNRSSDDLRLAARTVAAGGAGYFSGLLDIIEPKEATIDGRHAGLMTIAIGAENLQPYRDSYRAVNILGKQHIKVDGFNLPTNVFFRPLDEAENRTRSFDPHGPNRWQCTKAGVAPGATWVTVGGPVASWGDVNIVKLASLSALIQTGDYFWINGIATRAESVGADSAAVLMDALMGDTIRVSQGFDTSQPPVITLPQTEFRAFWEGAAGTTAQRPVLRPQDAGFRYDNETTGRREKWTGTEWVSDTEPAEQVIMLVGNKRVQAALIDVDGTGDYTWSYTELP